MKQATCTYQKMRANGQGMTIPEDQAELTVDLTGYDQVKIEYEIMETDEYLTYVLAKRNITLSEFNKTASTADGTVADRMFLSTYDVGTPVNKQPALKRQSRPVDSIALVACNEVSHQKWEDGGNGSTGTAYDADFEYFVTGVDCTAGNSSGKTVWLSR